MPRREPLDIPHCKRSQGPLTKRLPVGAGLAPNGTDGWLEDHHCIPMFCGQHQCSSAKAQGIPARTPDGSSWTSSTATRTCSSTTATEGAAHWLFSTSTYSSHIKAVLRLSGFFCPQPVLKKLSRLKKQNSSTCFHLRTAYPSHHLSQQHFLTFSSPSWCFLCLFRVCPLAFSKWHSSIQQCWDSCICGVSKRLLPPRFFLLSMMVPRGLKKTPKLIIMQAWLPRYQE